MFVILSVDVFVFKILAKEITLFDDNIWNGAFGLLICDRFNQKNNFNDRWM